MSHFAPKEIKSSHSVVWPSLPANINGVYPLASEAHQSPCFSMYEQNLWRCVVLPDGESHKTQQDYQVPFEVQHSKVTTFQILHCFDLYRTVPLPSDHVYSAGLCQPQR
ncbi:hypothetical protein ACFX1X_021663 [Malus domestica]